MIQKIDTLFFGDIDGCLVKAFPAGNLNQAAFAEQVKLQPINEYITKSIKSLFQKYELEIGAGKWIIDFATGRKASLLGDITQTHLKDIWYYINEIHYYDENLAYEPFSTYVDWKLNKLIGLLAQYKPKRTIVLEDSIEIINAIAKFLPKLPIDYRFVVKDRYIINPTLVADCKVDSTFEIRGGI